MRSLILTMLFGFSFVSYLERVNISIAAELMMPALSMTKLQMGQIFSSFLIGYAIFQIPAGLLGDSKGPRFT
ncbi:MAG: MFS transporter, partial [Acidobacteria bacterium]|nr:MFS transporter [Acidobacteriota bacterium]